jgi:hypothetical protein
MSTNEELLGRKSSGSNLEIREYDPSRWQRGNLYPQKLALTSSTSFGGSIGTVRSRTPATEFFGVLAEIRSKHIWNRRHKQRHLKQLARRNLFNSVNSLIACKWMLLYSSVTLLSLLECQASSSLCKYADCGRTCNKPALLWTKILIGPTVTHRRHSTTHRFYHITKRLHSKISHTYPNQHAIQSLDSTMPYYDPIDITVSKTDVLAFEVRSYFTADGQSVCLGIEHPCGTCDLILLPVGMLLSEICCLVSMGRPLRREDSSAICSVITQWSEWSRTRNHFLLCHLRLPQPDVLAYKFMPWYEIWTVLWPGNQRGCNKRNFN